MEKLNLAINIEPINNNNGTYTLILSHSEFREIDKGLIHMDKQRKASREYNRKKRLNDPYNPTGEGSIPTLHLQPMIDDTNSTYTLILSTYELKEIKKCIKYLETQRESARKYYVHKIKSTHQTFPEKHLVLNIVNSV